MDSSITWMKINRSNFLACISLSPTDYVFHAQNYKCFYVFFFSLFLLKLTFKRSTALNFENLFERAQIIVHKCVKKHLI